MGHFRGELSPRLKRTGSLVLSRPINALPVQRDIGIGSKRPTVTPPGGILTALGRERFPEAAARQARMGFTSIVTTGQRVSDIANPALTRQRILLREGGFKEQCQNLCDVQFADSRKRIQCKRECGGKVTPIPTQVRIGIGQATSDIQAIKNNLATLNTNQVELGKQLDSVWQKVREIDTRTRGLDVSLISKQLTALGQSQKEASAAIAKSGNGLGSFLQGTAFGIPIALIAIIILFMVLKK